MSRRSSWRDIFFRQVFLVLRLGHFILGIQTSSLNFQTTLLPLEFFGTQPSFFVLSLGFTFVLLPTTIFANPSSKQTLTS
jgi:hypothetical protein